jgi:CheY-like chemotaxis protein
MKTQNQKTILLVEDESIVSLATATKLKRFGYAVITAHTGESRRRYRDTSVVIYYGPVARQPEEGNGPEASVRRNAGACGGIFFRSKHAD